MREQLSNHQKQYLNSDSALFDPSDSETDQIGQQNSTQHGHLERRRQHAPDLPNAAQLTEQSYQENVVESPKSSQPDQAEQNRVHFPVELPSTTTGAFLDSPLPSPRRFTPKRRQSQEFDPINNILDSYWNDTDQPISIAATKRQRFLAPSRGERLRNVGKSIFAVANQKCFRPSYRPLPDGCIRLLILHPGEGDDPISMTLGMRNLDENPGYEALSYVWGDDVPLNPVVVFDRSQGPILTSSSGLKGKERLKQALSSKISVFYVRRNLYAALRRFREPAPKDSDGKVDLKRYWHARYHRVFWVDALCINQRDNAEKSRQLLRMPEIYSTALKVVVWLGEGTGSSDLSMEFIQEMVQDRLAGSITKLEITKKKIDSFLELMRCQWFARRWIIQEIFFATNAALYYGKKSHHLEKFDKALAKLMRDLRDPDSEIRQVAALQPASLEKLDAYGANVLYKLRSELLEEDSQGDIQRSQTLDYLVPRLTAFDAGDPRDIIFGVRNLARNTEGTPLPPVDYTASVLDVFGGFVKYACAWQLDIICRHWAPVEATLFVSYNEQDRGCVDTILPSWIPQLHGSEFGPPKDVFRGRINGTPLIGETSPLYSASKGARDVIAEFGLRKIPKFVMNRPIPKAGTSQSTPCILLEEIYDGTLIVKGLVLGRVNVRSDRMIPEVIPRDAIAMGGWQFRNFEGHNKLIDVPDQLWKTLIAKKHSDGSDANIGDKHACLAMLKREDTQGDIHIRELLRDPDFSADKARKEYLERVRVVCWNRRVFLGGQDENGRELFGLCSDNTEQGDLVCVIYGLSVPVILRKTNGFDITNLGFKQRPRAQLSRRKATKSPHHTPLPELLHSFGPATPNQRKRKWSSSPSMPPEQFTRPTPPPTLTPRNPYYKLVGECYVNGMMDGQAIANNQYKPMEQLFTLV
jgi:hypothetical protein